MIHKVQNPNMLVTAVWRQTQRPRKSTPYLILNTALWTIEKNPVVSMLFSSIVKLGISQPLQNLLVHNSSVPGTLGGTPGCSCIPPWWQKRTNSKTQGIYQSVVICLGYQKICDVGQGGHQNPVIYFSRQNLIPYLKIIHSWKSYAVTESERKHNQNSVLVFVFTFDDSFLQLGNLLNLLHERRNSLRFQR